MSTAHASSRARARSARRPRAPHALIHLLAHVRAPWLDRDLAAGAAPWRSPAHAERALQLTSERARARLGRTLESLVERTMRPPGRSSAVIPTCAQQVNDALPEILDLGARLRAPAPIAARGAAELRILLSSGGGPFYQDGERGDLAVALTRVLRCLDVDT